MEPLLDEKAAAGMIGCSVALMRKLRLNGDGPAFHRIGRLVRYAPEDVRAYLNTRRVEPVGGIQ